MNSLRIPSVSRLLVIAVLLAAKCSAQFNLTSLPACDQNCFDVAIRAQKDCPVTNTTCLCADQVVSSSLRYCIESNCSYEDAVAAENYALQYCPSFAPSTTTSSNSSATSGAAGDSTSAVNKASKGLATGTKIGVGVVVPLGVLFIVFGILFYRHTRKERKRSTLPPPVTTTRSARGSSRNRSRSQSRNGSQPRSVSLAKKRSSKSEMRQSSRGGRSSTATPAFSFEQNSKSFDSSSNSRRTSSATTTNPMLMNAAAAAGLVPIASTGKRGVTFDADLEKTVSNGGSDNSSTAGSLGKVGSNASSRAGSSYRSLSPIAEPTSMLQSRPPSAARVTAPAPIAVSVYNNRERLKMPNSPPYAQHQSEPLPPPSPATPLHYVFSDSDVEGKDGSTSARLGSSRGTIGDAVAEPGNGKTKKSKKNEIEPRWKQWRDRQSMLSTLSAGTSGTAPKLDSMYNAI